MKTIDGRLQSDEKTRLKSPYLFYDTIPALWVKRNEKEIISRVEKLHSRWEAQEEMPKSRRWDGVYQRPDTPFWWCSYTDAEGKRVRPLTVLKGPHLGQLA